MDTPPGSTSVPASAPAFISARVNQRASSISCSSTRISVDSARATKPSIRLAGSGQGWLPK